jgi:hypothetical protein
VFVSVTAAPEITAPVGSVTVPLTVPRLVWANAASVRLKNKSVKRAAPIFIFSPSNLRKVIEPWLGALSKYIDQEFSIYLRNNYSIVDLIW